MIKLIERIEYDYVILCDSCRKAASAPKQALGSAKGCVPAGWTFAGFKHTCPNCKN